MPIDPTIPLSGGTAPNPLAAVGNIQDMQSKINQNKLFAQTFYARQKAGQILASSPDLETGLQALYQDPDVAPFAGEIVASARQGMLAQTQQQRETQSQAADATKTLGTTVAPQIINNPQNLANVVAQGVATAGPNVRKQVGDYGNAMVSSLLGGLPSDYSKWTPQHMQMYNQRAVALATSLGIPPDQLSSVIGKSYMQDAGGQIVAGVQAPAVAGGGITQTGAIGKSLAPTLGQRNVLDANGNPTGATAPQVFGGGGGGTGSIIVPRGAGGGGNLPQPDVSTGTPGNPLVSPALQANIDRANKNVPAASGGPGSAFAPGPSTQSSEYFTGRTKKMEDYETDLDDRVTVGQGQRQNSQEILGMAKQAQLGGGADLYAKLGSLLQAFGVNNDTVDKLSNGSLPASQTIDKVSLNNSMNQLKQQLTGVGGSRINQQEFAAYLSKNPNLTTDPRALVEVFNLWNHYYDRDLHEQTALDGYKQSGGDLKRWPAVWANSPYMQGFAPTTPFSPEGVKGIGPNTGAKVDGHYIPGQGYVPAGGQ